MIIDDRQLLAELDEISGTPLHAHLQKMRTSALERVKGAPTDRMANIATGELSVLDELVGQIEGSHDRLAEFHEEARKPKPDMAKSF